MKSNTGGPVAKAFNTADEEASPVTARLIRDAGYEPVRAGGLENARALEDFLGLISAVRQSGTGPFWYRFSLPETS